MLYCSQLSNSACALAGRRHTVRRLQPAAGSQVPRARAYHALVALGPLLLLFGGRQGGGNLVTAEQMAVYDTRTDQWTLPGGPRPESLGL